jgi:tetratricopeptide (TPR) repeat protein
MSKISLRAYNREIDGLVDQGQTDEAIAHCKYILKILPKHLETYKLLGKAFLETRQYSEASDILLRVLNVVPDDFIAQIGMSIIREDEGNLDAAIWHMERAFEVQPPNNAIQDELKRLFGRRDGVAPAKVHLTRAALIRMYSRGELYPQAIAEAQAALSEDPMRLDIEVLLARVYYLANDGSNAARISLRLISKLPFCYEANKILTEVLPSTTPSDELSKYKHIINVLDPYSIYISPNTPIAAQVPDNAINIERMVWRPYQMDQQPSEWAQNIGVQLAENEDSNFVDWAIPDNPATMSSDVISPFDYSPPASLINGISSIDPNFEEIATEEAEISVFEPDNDLRSTFFSAQELSKGNGFSEDGISDFLEGISPPYVVIDDEIPPSIKDLIHTTSSAERSDSPPDWIKESFAVDDENPIISEGNSLLDEKQPPEEPIPDWLRLLDSSLKLPESEFSEEGSPPERLPGLKLEKNPHLDKDGIIKNSEEEKGEGLPGWLDGVLLENDYQEEIPTLGENLIHLPKIEENPEMDEISTIGRNDPPSAQQKQEVSVDSIEGQGAPSMESQSEIAPPIKENDNDLAKLKNLETNSEIQDSPEMSALSGEIIPGEATSFPPIPSNLESKNSTDALENPQEILLSQSNALPESEIPVQTGESRLDGTPTSEDAIDLNQGELISERLLPIVESSPVEITGSDLNNLYDQAKSSLNNNDFITALDQYADLIQAGQFLEQIIHDLNDALLEHPININVWEILGDAHFKASHLQEALNAYTKAEELLS